MMSKRFYDMKLRYGVIAGLVLMLFSMYPQLKLWYAQGADWKGHYAYNDIDEVAYAAYLKALIDGRSRLNDPYTGRDKTLQEKNEESLFSIQFLAPYSIAILARLAGISAASAMWLSGAAFAFLIGLVLFVFFHLIARDSIFAMMGALLTICTGALAAGEGAIGELLGFGFPYPYFPGFRRYVPIVALFAFFATLTMVWMMFISESIKKRVLFCILASIGFSVCLFSYFYIWTTALAWFISLAVIFPLFRPLMWKQNFQAVSALLFACSLPIIPYAIMLSHRSQTLDQVQLLVFTRELDLLRVPELICFFMLGVIILLAIAKCINIRDRLVIFTISLLLVPPITFNQQLITGRVLQPIHYQVFIGNYVASLCMVLLLWIFVSTLKKGRNFKSLWIVLCILSVLWGLIECHYTVRPLDEANVWRDEAVPVGKRLAELAEAEGNDKVVFAPDLIQGDDMPTLTSQPVLWARHQHIFPGVSWEESKQRYYQHLYFSGIDKDDLIYLMENGDFVSIIALFGWGKHTDRLNPEYEPLTYGEIYQEADRFNEYIKSFNPSSSPGTILSYIVVPADWDMDFSNIDRWYHRSEPEIHGRYLLYKLNLREEICTCRD